MDSHRSRNTTRRPEEPTAASILGIKGQLRFRPHGSTQKAHVVLRQVDWSPEDPDEEADSSMVYFSLFAQKRIEVKPGKEILLAVATPDGTFLDTPVIFAGKLTGEDADNVGGASDSTGFDFSSTLSNTTLPPKMRKTWSKRTVVQIESKPVLPPLRTSVGTQTGQPEPEVESLNEPEAPLEDSPSPRRDRSLSPMELDSAPSSPSPSSPVSLPEVHHLPKDATKSASFSPPGLGVPMSPQAQPAVSHARLLSVDLPSHSETPPVLPAISQSEPPRPASPVRPVPIARDEDTTSRDRSPNDAHIKPPLRSPGTVTAVPLRVTVPAPLPDSTGRVVTPSPAVTPTAAPYVPKRKIVPNPFVSGGLLTDFVSTSAAKKDDSVGRVLPVESGSASPAEIPGLSHSATSIAPSAVTSAVIASGKDDGSDSDSSLSISTPSETPASPIRRTPSPVSPASPSSSKVKVEDILPPRPPPQQPISNDNSLAYDPARPDLQLQRNVPLFPPPMAMPNFPPNLVRGAPSAPAPPQPSIPQWSNGHVPPQQPPRTARRPSLPPDSKSLTPIPASSYSNPLGIRPAAPSGSWKHDKYNPNEQSPPPSLPTPPVPKKPVPIGSGWPHNRHTNGHVAAKTGPRWSSGKAPAFVGASQPTSVSPVTSYLNGSSPTTAPNPPIPPQSSKAPLHNQESMQTSYSSGPPPPNNAPIPIPQLNGYERTPSTPAIPIPTSTPPAFVPASASVSRPRSSITLPSAHPLPVKPVSFVGELGTWSPSMGIKRMGSPSLQSQSPDTRRARSFNWPTSEPIFSLNLTSDTDPGIRTICHNSDGSLCAVTCYDKSVRILSTKTRTELAKLAHNMQVTAVAWMDRDAGVVTLGDNGIVSTWTRSAGNKWQWAKILDANAGRSEDEPGCLAFAGDRIAISYPRVGVKVWLFIKGTWLPQRSILRQNVTAIKFVEEGEALIGGTTDGVLWYCQVPNGTLRAYSFMKSQVFALDVDPRGNHALAAQTGGKSHLVNISQDDQKGKIEQVYFLKDPDSEPGAAYDFGAFFASRGQRILFGTTRGCIMIWDRSNGNVVHGLNHGEDHTIQAVSCFDGAQAADGHILTGSRQGHLTWFSQPPG
ncbi:hypothetical protein BC629DRAFT_1596860 [Irpex lacteus]|nr:hypothetical protein BC629DRAFT_1596860 [Irpex lacteus]